MFCLSGHKLSLDPSHTEYDHSRPTNYLIFSTKRKREITKGEKKEKREEREKREKREGREKERERTLNKRGK